jgi:hypothetical protein
MPSERDPGPIQRLEACKSDPAFPRVVFQRLTDGEAPETLLQIARALEIPRGLFVEWFSTEHANLYDAALKVRAGEYGEEAVSIADGATPETVAVERLRADTRLKVASKWDRPRYGDSDGGPKGPMVVIQVAQLRAPERVVAGEPLLIPVEPAEAAI